MILLRPPSQSYPNCCPQFPSILPLTPSNHRLWLRRTQLVLTALTPLRQVVVCLPVPLLRHRQALMYRWPPGFLILCRKGGYERCFGIKWRLIFCIFAVSAVNGSPLPPLSETTIGRNTRRYS